MTNEPNHDISQVTNIVHSSTAEKVFQSDLVGLLKNTPVSDDELLANLGLYLTSKNFSRLLFFYEIYCKVVNLHGVIMEFGTRWGQTVSVLAALRGIFEPFNRVRKIIGFDTFAGHKGIGPKDGVRHNCQDGDFGVSLNYEAHLEAVLTAQEGLNPIGHIKKFELIKGDVTQTLPAYLNRHQETVVSLAVFDLDLYAPTKSVLETIQPYLSKGSILVFDNVGDEIFPGETRAFREVFGGGNLTLARLPMTSRLAYAEIE